jgi:tRNA(Arg) A34 adenosine deaminase TadA
MRRITLNQAGDIMWSDLPLPWQKAFELSWQAYAVKTNPIGAVITDERDLLFAEGRNRISDREAPSNQIAGTQLAHAEMNALLSALSRCNGKLHYYTLYTTLEPCPLCMGAIYMSGLRTVFFAARDIYAGSSNLIGATPYYSVKPVKVQDAGMQNLGNISMTMNMEYGLVRYGETSVMDCWEKDYPRAALLARSVFQSGALRSMADQSRSAAQAYDQVEQWLQEIRLDRKNSTD